MIDGAKIVFLLAHFDKLYAAHFDTRLRRTQRAMVQYIFRVKHILIYQVHRSPSDRQRRSYRGELSECFFTYFCTRC